MLPYFLMWFAMLAVAIGNGVLREKTFARSLPERRAHQLSTFIGAGAMGVLMWFIIRWWPPTSGREALIIGLLWLGLTVGFEFFMGLVLQKRPWAEVIGAYDLRRGRVWVLFLVWITVAPWLFYSLQET
jgi:hypothetical protein